MSWSIIDSGRILQETKKLLRRARQEGRLSLVATKIEHILKTLSSDPLAVGEPHNRLKHLDLLLCVVVDRPVSIEYAVDEKRHWVYLRQIKLI